MNDGAPLTDAQAKAVFIAMTYGGGDLVRMRGGYWTFETCNTFRNKLGLDEPELWAATGTIYALVNRGYFKIVESSIPGGVALRVRCASRKRGDRSSWLPSHTLANLLRSSVEPSHIPGFSFGSRRPS